MVISRSIHVVENGITSVFFVLNSIPLYFYTMSSLSTQDEDFRQRSTFLLLKPTRMRLVSS